MFVIVTYPLDDTTDGPSVDVYGPYETKEEAQHSVPDICYYNELFFDPYSYDDEGDTDDISVYERERLRTKEQIMQEVDLVKNTWHNFDYTGMHLISICKTP